MEALLLLFRGPESTDNLMGSTQGASASPSRPASDPVLTLDPHLPAFLGTKLTADACTSPIHSEPSQPHLSVDTQWGTRQVPTCLSDPSLLSEASPPSTV